MIIKSSLLIISSVKASPISTSFSVLLSLDFPQLPWTGMDQHGPWSLWDLFYTHHSLTSMLVKFFLFQSANSHQDTHSSSPYCVSLSVLWSLSILMLLKVSALICNFMCLISYLNVAVLVYSSLKWEMEIVPLITVSDIAMM